MLLILYIYQNAVFFFFFFFASHFKGLISSAYDMSCSLSHAQNGLLSHD